MGRRRRHDEFHTVFPMSFSGAGTRLAGVETSIVVRDELDLVAVGANRDAACAIDPITQM